MTRKYRALSLAAIVAASICAGPAMAAPNLFTPVTGYDFVPLDFQTAQVTYANGSVSNRASASVTLEASLGHAGGGSGNGFWVFGVGNGVAVTCQVWSISTTGVIVGPAATNTATAFGSFSMFINTAIPAGDIFYSIDCKLPASNGGFLASILGVRPTN